MAFNSTSFTLKIFTMKKTICFALLVIMTTSILGQQAPSVKTDYQLKSKNQKSTAWVLLGGGAVLIGAGFLIGDRKESSFDDAGTGVVIGGIGVLATLGSIPLFIASAKNKRKARALTTSFKMEETSRIRGYTISKINSPALCLKINL